MRPWGALSGNGPGLWGGALPRIWAAYACLRVWGGVGAFCLCVDTQTFPFQKLRADVLGDSEGHVVKAQAGGHPATRLDSFSSGPFDVGCCCGILSEGARHSHLHLRSMQSTPRVLSGQRQVLPPGVAKQRWVQPPLFTAQ